MRLAWRLAWRDASRHLRRTFLATLLIALTIGVGVFQALIINTANTDYDPLQELPPGTQARIITFGSSPEANSQVEQSPLASAYQLSGGDGPIPDASELSKYVSGNNQLAEFWLSSDLLAKHDSHATVLRLTEGTDALRSISPQAHKQLDGPDQIVLSARAAEYLHARKGDQIELHGPRKELAPSANFSIPMTEKTHVFTVAGVVEADGKALLAWALPGWVSQSPKDASLPARTFLVNGSDPVTWNQVKQLNKHGALVISRHVIDNPPPDSELYPIFNENAEKNTRAALGLGASTGFAIVFALFLVTPAFTVAAEQSARTLGMIAVIGASPRQIRRIMSRQGSVIGLLGGIFGILIGASLALLQEIVFSQAEPAQRLTIPAILEVIRAWPLWIAPTAITCAVICGWISALLPAYWASRQNVLQILGGVSPSSRQRPRHRWLSPILLFIGFGLLATAFYCQQIELFASNTAIDEAILAVGVVISVLGLVAAIPGMISRFATLSAKIWLPLRLALRDADQHRRRTTPTAAAVLLLVIAYTLIFTINTTQTQNMRQHESRFLAQGHVAIAVRVPTDTENDRLILANVRERLAKSLPISGYGEVFDAFNDGTKADMRRLQTDPNGRICPPNTGPKLTSLVTAAAPLKCAKNSLYGQSGAFRIPRPNTPVYDARAMHASGLPRAETAAQALKKGGIVVNSGYAYDGKQAWIADYKLGSDGNPTELVGHPMAFPGEFVLNINTQTGFIASPQAAEKLGYQNLQLNSQILETTRPLTEAEFKQAWDRQVADLRGLVEYEGPTPLSVARENADATITLAVALIMLLLLWVSLSLARIQLRADMATMGSIGASSGFSRRYCAAQAFVILGVSVPLGAVSGLAMAYGYVWWIRTGADNQSTLAQNLSLFVVPWPWLAAIWIGIPTLTIAFSWLAGRVNTPLVARSLD